MNLFLTHSATKAKKLLFILSIIIFTCSFQDARAQDVGVFKITSPSSSCSNLSASESITVLVVNYGSTTVDTIPVSYKVGLGTAVSEQIINTLNSGDSVSYSFSTKADLSSAGAYTIIAFTTLATDINAANNAATTIAY